VSVNKGKVGIVYTLQSTGGKEVWLHFFLILTLYGSEWLRSYFPGNQHRIGGGVEGNPDLSNMEKNKFEPRLKVAAGFIG